jgi:hypothetical protein
MKADTPKYIKEFKSNLRYAFKSSALNMFRKVDRTKLSPEEIRKILNYLMENYWSNRPYIPNTYEQISKDKFIAIFREIFKKEIKIMKEI